MFSHLLDSFHSQFFLATHPQVTHVIFFSPYMSSICLCLSVSLFLSLSLPPSVSLSLTLTHVYAHCFLFISDTSLPLSGSSASSQPYPVLVSLSVVISVIMFWHSCHCLHRLLSLSLHLCLHLSTAMHTFSKIFLYMPA